jgi:hypothetical protein
MKLLGVVLVCPIRNPLVRNQGYRAVLGAKPVGRSYMSANRTCETGLLRDRGLLSGGGGRAALCGCRRPEPGMALAESSSRRGLANAFQKFERRIQVVAGSYNPFEPRIVQIS